MEKQIFQFPKKQVKLIVFEVLEIYPGRKWNDTCLSELNIETDDGWVFNME